MLAYCSRHCGFRNVAGLIEDIAAPLMTFRIGTKPSSSQLNKLNDSERTFDLLPRQCHRYVVDRDDLRWHMSGAPGQSDGSLDLLGQNVI